MKHPLISKHIRIKAFRTPLLEELVSYSKKSGRPNERHLENIYKVWRGFSSKDQSSYVHIPEMLTDLNKYLLNNSASPKGSPNTTMKNTGLGSRSFSNRIKRTDGTSRRLLMSSRGAQRKPTNLSPETKNIAINLNKDKLEEEENMLRPRYLAQKLGQNTSHSHKSECTCEITEMCYDLCTPHLISPYKIFISCRYGASNLPSLMRNNIHSVLSIGESPNTYPRITGGYYQIVHEGTLSKTLFAACRFLNLQLTKGNVLIHCDSGNNISGVILMAYILMETNLTYLQVLGLLKKARPNFYLNEEQETYVKTYDNNKAGLVS